MSRQALFEEFARKRDVYLAAQRAAIVSIQSGDSVEVVMELVRARESAYQAMDTAARYAVNHPSYRNA